MNGSSVGNKKRISAFAAYNNLPQTEFLVPTVNLPAVAVERIATPVAKSNKKSKRGAQSNESPVVENIDDDCLIVDQSNESSPSVTPLSAKIVEETAKKRKLQEIKAAKDTSVNGNHSAGKSTKKKKIAMRLTDIINGEKNDDTNNVMPSPITVPKTSTVPAAKPATTDKKKDANVSLENLLKSQTYHNSLEEAQKAFTWLISPQSTEQFKLNHWEKKPLLVKRETNYYENLFSSEELLKIMQNNDIQYSVNVDITKYENGVRKTLNPVGRAYPSVVRDFYKQGCSVRLLNPQSYSAKLWQLNSSMQEYFGTFVGANVYLTPSGTQGFAPHYDDIEAFILQLEGAKHWKIYSPLDEETTLPRVSSKNFSQDEIGKPIMEVTLRPGDLLYFPRGFIHQAIACDGEHSLHLTISTTQKHTWGDLLALLLDQALESAVTSNIDYRKSLPLDYMSVVGTANTERIDAGRMSFIDTAKKLLSGLLKHISVDDAADQMAKKFMHDSLPPCLTQEEAELSIVGRKVDQFGSTLDSKVNFRPNTKVKLLRKHCLRIVLEKEESVTIYYNTENSRVYHEKDLQSIEISPDLAPAVDYLAECYPNYVTVDSLPVESAAEKAEICRILYEKGLMLAKLSKA